MFILNRVLIENNEVLLWAVVTLVCIFLVELWRRNRNLPPGPWGLPFFGYYPFVGSRPYIKLNELSFKYGDVMSFRTVGGHLIVMLHRLPVTKEVFISRSDEFIGRPLEDNFVTWFDNGMGIAQIEGSAWKEQRRFFLQAAKTFGFGKIEAEPLMHELLHAMIEDIQLLDERPFDPMVHVSHVTANMIASILFKKRFSKEDPKFKKYIHAFKELLAYFTDSRLLLVGPVFQYILMKLHPSGRKSERTRDFLVSSVSDIVEEHERTFDENHLRDYVDCFLYQMKKMAENGSLSNSSFSRDRLVAIAYNMFHEGTESTGSGLCTFMVELAHHKNEQIKAQEELDSVIGRSRLPSWNDRQSLPYTDALIQELYRKGQPFFTSAYYSNYEETTIRNYRIPKRSIILVNLWSINNDPMEFSEPSKFDPNRYLMPDGKKMKQERPTSFGIGKRACIAEVYAQKLVFVFMASVVQNFTLYPDVTREGWIKAVPRDKL